MKIALQLYSIREITEKHGLCAALDQAKELGYDGIEFAGLFGLDANHAKAELDKRGLGCAGFHDGYTDVLEHTDAMIEKAKYAARTVFVYHILTPIRQRNGQTLRKNWMQQEKNFKRPASDWAITITNTKLNPSRRAYGRSTSFLQTAVPKMYFLRWIPVM